jgi:hypothetical protein
MRDAVRIGTLTLVLALVGAAPALGSWHDLRGVTVTVSNPSLPPPGGKPQTTSFLPGHGLRRAQHALNANHIHRLSVGRPLLDCTGGFSVVIKIVQSDSKVFKLNGYRCGGVTFGRIGGNLPRFLKAVGITRP